jgi:hypothetical protein
VCHRAVVHRRLRCAAVQIDVEGHEWEVLQGVDGEHWPVIEQVRGRVCVYCCEGGGCLSASPSVCLCLCRGLFMHTAAADS